jgi:steroid 5-alpha reductase family enzyme
MPVTVLNSPNVTRSRQPSFGKATDVIGVIGFVIGITMEAVSDIQKYRFKQMHQERGAVCDKGFFAWSRHPNYFGEILIQFCKPFIFPASETSWSMIIYTDIVSQPST